MERSQNVPDYDSDEETGFVACPVVTEIKPIRYVDPIKRKWKPITLVNVVVTGSTKCALDLHHLSRNLLNAEYFPKKFAALKLCRTNPFAKALVFRSGKIVCVGTTSIERAYESLEWFTERIRSIEGNHVTIHDQTIQNMVATTGLINDKESVNLQKVFDNCPQKIQYEPYVFLPPYVVPARVTDRCALELFRELFPGLSFRQDMHKQGVLNIFGTGKCVLTGLRSMNDIPEMFRNFLQFAVSDSIFW